MKKNIKLGIMDEKRKTKTQIEFEGTKEFVRQFCLQANCADKPTEKHYRQCFSCIARKMATYNTEMDDIFAMKRFVSAMCIYVSDEDEGLFCPDYETDIDRRNIRSCLACLGKRLILCESFDD